MNTVIHPPRTESRPGYAEITDDAGSELLTVRPGVYGFLATGYLVEVIDRDPFAVRALRAGGLESALAEAREWAAANLTAHAARLAGIARQLVTATGGTADARAEAQELPGVET